MTETPYLEDAAGRQFPLVNQVITLGRSPECGVFIADPCASRRHAEIRWQGELCTLKDLASANGTFLNGRRITALEVLQDGDEIKVASAIFTFRDPGSTFRSTDFPRLIVDSISGEIWVNSKPVVLSPKERDLFVFLHKNVGKPCSKDEIAQVVWPEYQAEVYDYQIESLVKRLREKLEPDPRAPAFILTLPGRGYKLAHSS